MKNPSVFFKLMRDKNNLVFALGFVTVFLIGVLDHITGAELGFFLFYLLPITYVTYFGNTSQGIIISIFSAVVWLFVDLSTGHENKSHWVSLWNSSIRLSVFLMISIGLSKIKFYQNRFRELVEFIIHDLRTPINNMLLGIENACKSQGPEISNKQKNVYELCQASAKRMSMLVDGILDLSKMEHKRLKLHVNKTNLESIVNESLETVHFYAERQRVSLQKDIKSKIELNSDEELLKRVMINLLSNSIKASPPDATINVLTEDVDQNKIKVTVSDTGYGIPAKMLDSVFEKYSQLEFHKKGFPTGSGLGLTFCREVIHKLGGQIWAESEINKGTKMIFVIPVNTEK